MTTSVMQPNTTCPSAEIVSNPRWALPPYSTTPVQPKTPPPSYSSVVNQQDHNTQQNHSLHDHHYRVQPHIDQDVPDQAVIFVPEPVENSKSRTIGTFAVIVLVFCIFSYIVRIVCFLH